jgi:hypothetical protein
MDLTPTDFLSGLGGLGNLPHPYEDQQQVTQDQQQNQAGKQQLALGALKLGAIQQQQQQAQQYQTDVANALKTGNFAGLYAKYPDQQKQLQAAHDALDEPAKRTQERDLFAVSSYIKNGAVDSAKKLLQQRIDADKAAGQDASDDLQMLDALNNGDPAHVKAAADMALYAILPEDKRGEFFKPQDGKKFTNTPQGDIYDQTTGEVVQSAAPKPEVDTRYVFDENGNRIGSRKVVHAPAGGVTGEQIEQLALNAVPGAVVTSGARSPCA